MEKWFEASAAYLCRKRIPAIIVVLLATAAAATGLRNLAIDTSTESFLRAGDPVLERYEEFRDQFGRDDVIIVSVTPDELFTLASLTELKKLHDSLASGVPSLAGITSM
ncbi:MAG: Fis family transcriptional regulator, partial [Boseongicola sp. SB0673_bin_14]|nr:Fis family transcriptional regulator [Boseongicola sp. SB0673_bin_14]